jgi:hypothetical protein
LAILIVLASRRDKLDATAALAFDAAQILALAANDESDEAGFDLDRLRIIILASQRRPVTPATTMGAARGEALAAAAGRIRALAAIVTTALVGAAFVAVWVEVVAIRVSAPGRALGSRPSVLPRIGLTLVRIRSSRPIVWGDALLRCICLGLRDCIG